MGFFVNLDKNPKIEVLLDKNRVLLVQFTKAHYDEQNKFFIQNAFSLEQIRKDFVVKINLCFSYKLLPTKKEELSVFWGNIKNLILRNGDKNPQTNVILQIEKEDGTIQIVDSHRKVHASKSFVDDLTRFLPLQNIHFDYKHNFERELVRN